MGLPKDRYFLYRSTWAPEKRTVHLLPHWNWPDRAGQTVPVYVYTSGDSAELFLNGRSLGTRTKDRLAANVLDRYRLRWEDVIYEPGTLQANGDDLAYLKVRLVDRKGQLCPLAMNPVHFTLDGPATIAGVGNGDHHFPAEFVADHVDLFYGQAMLVLRTTAGAAGRVRVEASSEGLRTAKTSLRVLRPRR